MAESVLVRMERPILGAVALSFVLAGTPKAFGAEPSLSVNASEGWKLVTQTLATYSIYTDTGGLIPPFFANRASQIGIGRLFETVRKRVKDPKYAAEDHLT